MHLRTQPTKELNTPKHPNTKETKYQHRWMSLAIVEAASGASEAAVVAATEVVSTGSQLNECWPKEPHLHHHE